MGRVKDPKVLREIAIEEATIVDENFSIESKKELIVSEDIDERLLVPIKDSPLPSDKARAIVNLFDSKFSEVKLLEGELESIKLMEEGSEKESAANLLLKKLSKVFSETRKIHQEKKSFFLNGGRAVDGVYNVVRFVAEEMKLSAKEIAEKSKREEQARLQKIADERKEQLRKYMEVGIPEDKLLWTMEQSVFEKFLAVQKSEFEEAEKKRKEEEEAEAKRKEEEIREKIKQEEEAAARKKVEQEQREKEEKARQENIEKGKKRKEELDKIQEKDPGLIPFFFSSEQIGLMTDEEFKKFKTQLKANFSKALKEKVKAEAEKKKAEEIRKKNEEAEKKRKEKEEAEKKKKAEEEAEKKRKEKEEAERKRKEAAAPDKEKLVKFAESLLSIERPKLKTAEAVAILDRMNESLEKMNKFIIKEIENL